MSYQGQCRDCGANIDSTTDAYDEDMIAPDLYDVWHLDCSDRTGAHFGDDGMPVKEIGPLIALHIGGIL